MGQLRPKQLKMKRGGVEGFQPTQEFYGAGTILDSIVIEEGVTATIYILAPGGNDGSQFIPVPTLYPRNANVPDELNNNFRFEEVENDITELASNPEPAVVTSVTSSVPAVQPLAIQLWYQTPQRIVSDIVRGRRYYRTVDTPEESRNQTSTLSRAEQETESEDDKSVDLGSQDSTSSGESYEYRKGDDDENDYIVYC